MGLGRMPRLRAGSWIWWGEEEEGTGVWGAPSEVQLGAGARAGPAGPPVSPGLQLMFAEHTLCGARPCPLAPHSPI